MKLTAKDQVLGEMGTNKQSLLGYKPNCERGSLLEITPWTAMATYVTGMHTGKHYVAVFAWQ